MNLPGKTGEILAFIVRYQSEQGAPPTLREIGRRFRIRSTNGVCYHLDLLEREGWIQRRKGSARGIQPSLAALEADPENASPRPGARAGRPGPTVGLPILGRIAAGGPVAAEEDVEGILDAGRISARGAVFALRVRGDSMIDAGILEGDLVIVRQRDQARAGSIVVALIGDEATVKYYRPRSGHVELVPANQKYEPIRVTEGQDFRILGVVTGVMRTVGS